ncbi:NAD(P)-dependent oxidoreductase [Mesorhizobium ventifaucium]|uniref:Phosphoglycerate dehydrogenase n=1 Tax=Mesorhizobium ventifaucium TaxID=666020 RepID=A0ABN8J9P4_9HYPH|nr:NAD(P)-dependent oxidoreductase [Mesorhizobium ventifaucium]CAH2394370.1 Phosphoglycerate dehydrogenase [Mesorhizobium ventifaucium]
MNTGEMKVLCLWHATQQEIENIKTAMPAGTEVAAPEPADYLSRYETTYADLERHASDADAFIGWTVPTGILEIAEKLKILSWLHVGVDDLRQMGAFSLIAKRKAKLANIAGANAIAIAEQGIMLMLALAKNAIIKHQMAVDGRSSFPVWGDESRSAMLHERTVAVIGVGRIGGRVAKHANAFDMNVLGVRRNKEQKAENVDTMYGPEELQAVLAQCDYVVLAAPNTRETTGLFGKAELAAMKPNAFLVNVGRAATIQEKPLYEALTSGRLRGFGTDVWWRYEFGRTFPIGWGSRLDIQRLPNVICSARAAHNADDVLERSIEWGIQNLVEFAAGQQLTLGVNLEEGY